MKLVELLVQELPRRGGWPDGAKDAIEMHMDGDIFFDGDHAPDDFNLPQCDDGWHKGLASSYSNEVTREQYEAALAAAQPQWNGEGLPPVGCECEFINDGIPWGTVEVLAHNLGVVVFKTDTNGYHGIVPSKIRVFRPIRNIRSEVDKKRDAAVDELSSVIDYRNGCASKPLAGWLYDAIAAGKIPHVHIE